MPNQTAERFGNPTTLIREYEHWLVLLRQQQITLGSLVLCAKSPATAYADLPDAAFSEMAVVIRDVESALKAAVAYDKINYLMLMMVDPNVHYHVFPRYDGVRAIAGIEIEDGGWPAAPQLGAPRDLDAAECAALCQHLRDCWPRD